MLGFRRLLAAAAVSCAIVLVGSLGVSAAGGSGRVPVPPGAPLTIDCGGVSAVATITFDKEFAKTSTLADGTVKMMVEGRLLTSVAGNGKVLDFNISGPGVIYFRPDGSVTVVSEGRLFYTPPTLEGMWLYAGHLTIDGVTGAILSHTGSVTDICALIRS